MIHQFFSMLYVVSTGYCFGRLFYRLPSSVKFWIVLLLSFAMNIITLGLLVYFVGIGTRLASLFSVAHERTAERNNDNTSSLSPLSPSWVVVPLSFMVRHNDEEVLAVIDESLHLSNSFSSRRRDPPNEEKLRETERLWSDAFSNPISNSNHNISEDECMICLQPSSTIVRPIEGIEGITTLQCSCSSLFHKKCILEWFYFVEKPSEENEGQFVVTCPSCRHVFSRTASSSSSTTTSSPPTTISTTLPNVDDADEGNDDAGEENNDTDDDIEDNVPLETSETNLEE